MSNITISTSSTSLSHRLYLANCQGSQGRAGAQGTCPGWPNLGPDTGYGVLGRNDPAPGAEHPRTWIWMWIWIVSRQGSVLEHHTDEELRAYGAP